jgi:hypothetical protein
MGDQRTPRQLHASYYMGLVKSIPEMEAKPAPIEAKQYMIETSNDSHQSIRPIGFFQNIIKSTKTVSRKSKV